VQQRAGDLLVPLDEHVGFDIHGLAEHSFDGGSAAIDGGPDLFDDCPATTVLWPFHVDSTASWLLRMEQVLCRAAARRKRTRARLRRASRSQ
jgi:hypothetical protein